MTKLTSGSTRFHHGVAICGRCVSEWSFNRTGEAILILANRVREGQTTECLGLLLFTPSIFIKHGLPLEAEIGNTYLFKTTHSPMGMQRA